MAAAQPRLCSWSHTPPVQKKAGNVPRRPGPSRNGTFSYTPSTTQEKDQTTTMPTFSPIARSTTMTLTTPATSTKARNSTPTSVIMPIVQRPRAKTHCFATTASFVAIAEQDRLDTVVSIGDILCVKGSPEGMNRLGANGGYMGHVLLVSAALRVVRRDSDEGIAWQNLFPSDGNVLWVVPTMESCRAQEGIYETEYLLYIDESGNIRLQGEVAPTGKLLRFETAEKLEVFQAPAELRSHLRHDLVNDVMLAVRSNQESWSWSTAIRAFLFSADMPTYRETSQDAALRAIQNCWQNAPICTSLIIVFWQRYLCRLADDYNDDARRHDRPEIDVLDWISRWMPLKSDRALPGDLLSTLHQCGWNVIRNVSQVRRRGRHNTL